MSIETIPAGHHILESQVRRYRDGCVQRAQEPSAGIGRTGRPHAASLWTSYVAGWTAWIHVRTGASLAAAASFTIAPCY
jgi:hypothetical protein